MKTTQEQSERVLHQRKLEIARRKNCAKVCAFAVRWLHSSEVACHPDSCLTQPSALLRPTNAVSLQISGGIRGVQCLVNSASILHPCAVGIQLRLGSIRFLEFQFEILNLQI